MIFDEDHFARKVRNGGKSARWKIALKAERITV